MDIHTRYDVGDTVWVLNTVRPDVPCPACVNGQIIGRDGEPYHCYNCDGTGIAQVGKPMTVPKPCVIARISAVATEDEVRVTYHEEDMFGLRQDERYCYPTEAEAPAAADRMNEEAK